MLPDPLHPALVHFPIVLMFMLPVTAAVAMWVIRRGAKPRRAWLAPIAVALALTGSSWLAIETGERQEDRVEQIVPEGALGSHEQAADRFLFLSLAVTGLIIGGVLAGRTGARLRGAGVAAAALLIVAGYQVGHSGAALVYRHGAASAYTGEAVAALGGPADLTGRSGREERDDEERRKKELRTITRR